MVSRKLVIANNPLLSGPPMMERERSGVPYRELSIDLIDRDPNQPRVNFDQDKLNELANSIRMYGVLTPVLVRPSKIVGRYMLIAGERRLRASQLAERSSIPALIDRGDEGNGSRTLAMQLVENLQRADLSQTDGPERFGSVDIPARVH